MSSYGEKVTYSQSEMVFPDFTLRYTGQTRVTSPVYGRGFVYENFVVTADGKEQAVRWSSGTGDIAPATFEVAGKRYLLEMRMSDAAGHLRNDEPIVRPTT